MYRLLIVDDEPTVRAGLRSHLNWASFGIEVMGEADDGDVALAMIAEEEPDLVLTDVRMPTLDGIAMAQQITARYPRCKIIFVSGHDDADYLKSAMKMSAVDYIFKPVNLQELSAVIARVTEDMEERRMEERQKRELLVKLQEGMPLLREKFLLSLITSGGGSRTIPRERITFLGLDLPVDASYWVVVLSVDDLAQVMASRSERDRQLLWYAVLNIYQELIDTHLHGYAFEYQNGEFVGILHAAGGAGQGAPGAEGEEAERAEALFALAGDIRFNLERYLKISVTIGISDRTAGLAELSHAYKQAREAAGHKWYLGKNRIITMDSLESTEAGAGGISRYAPLPNEPLISALKAADEDKLRLALDDLFADLNRNRRDGLKYGRNGCLQLILEVGQLLLTLGVPSPELEAEEARLWELVFEKETLGELRQLIEEHLRVACGRIREKRTGKVANLVERVRAVIEESYADSHFTVAEIGKVVYLTPTYVSLLFKQETGQTINEYLTQVRIDKAKELLRDPQHKLYDICYAIGYTDPSYFTKLFKKTTGLTPSVYREHHA